MEEVKEVIRKEVHDWDSEVMISTRFKAFSGQRSDWEPRYHFWRDLIIKISRHLNIFIISPSVVKNIWFNQGGLTPLCIDHVLLDMYNAGDLSCHTDLINAKSGQLSQLFHKVKHLLPLSKSTIPIEDEFIVSTLLEEKSDETVKLLSDDHWTSSCIITMSKFQLICGGPKEASMILSHLSKCGKAKYFSVKRNELIEGVKVSLSPKIISGVASQDYDFLHLTFTAEKLQLQLDTIDQRCDKSKRSALTSLKSGNKTIALRHAKELKLASQSREKCSVLLKRVEEVITAITEGQDSKEVLEAIQRGTMVIKDNKITIEEVEVCLDELNETISSQKEVDKVIGSGYEEFDEDIEDELDKLEKSLEFDGSETSKTLSKAFSDLKVADKQPKETLNISKVAQLEPC